MKNITVKDKQGNLLSDLNIYETEEQIQEFIRINREHNVFGRSERWIPEFSEEYSNEDIIGTKVEIENEVEITYVLLRADYTIQIEDATAKLANENRITELKKLLAESDFRMTNDYYNEMSEMNKTFWTNERCSWRSELRSLLI